MFNRNKKNNKVNKVREYTILPNEEGALAFYKNGMTMKEFEFNAYRREDQRVKDDIAKRLSINLEKNIINWEQVFSTGKIFVIPRPDIQVKPQAPQNPPKGSGKPPLPEEKFKDAKSQLPKRKK